MISGIFGEIKELICEIDIIGRDEERYPVEVLLDTGFTTGWLVLDTQDVESLGWSLIQSNHTMQMARGEGYFDIYEGRVILEEQEYIIPVLAAAGILEPLLGLQWLKLFSLAVPYSRNLNTRVNKLFRRSPLTLFLSID